METRGYYFKSLTRWFFGKHSLSVWPMVLSRMSFLIHGKMPFFEAGRQSDMESHAASKQRTKRSWKVSLVQLKGEYD